MKLKLRPRYCERRGKVTPLSKTKVTIMSIGYIGKGDVVVQRKIEKPLKVTMLSMKKSREYIRFCRQ